MISRVYGFFTSEYLEWSKQVQTNVSLQSQEILKLCSEWLYATNISHHLNMTSAEVERCLAELMDAQLINRSSHKPYSYRRSN